MEITSSPSLPGYAGRLLPLKGQFVGLNWTRSLKTYKGETRKVRKSVRTVVRIGLNYDNRGVVEQARASGELPAENAGLNGMEWVQHPVLLRSLKTGKLYVRAYPVRDADGKPRSCKSIYKIDGSVVSRDDAKAVCLASEFGAGGATDCYNIAVDSITGLRLVRRADGKTNFLRTAE